LYLTVFVLFFKALSLRLKIGIKPGV